MIDTHSFSKRIKRQVIGRRHTFFIATTPGINRLCHGELTSLSLSITGTAVFPGGIEFEGRLEDCYRANLFLRTASRVLMRLADVKASNLRQLRKKIADFHWELFLKPQPQLEFSISASHCRLYHKEAIRDGVRAGIADRFAPLTQTADRQDQPLPVQRLFVRGSDDRFTLSLDSSGDLLYKRGIKRHGGQAPIRETIAAAALYLAGYSGREPLIDPMCGAGTFSLEAGMTAAHIPAGWHRNFSFMDWPSFKPSQWEYIKNEAKQEFRFGKKPMIFASDMDQQATGALEKTVQSIGLSDNIHVCCRDFFDFKPSDITPDKGLVVINPPYGIRLETKRIGDKLFQSIVRKLAGDYQGWRFVLVSPEKKTAAGLPFHHSVYPVLHGGLNVHLIVGNI